VAKIDVIRAWKDEEYRAGLTDAERAQLPPNPAGLIELDDEQMKRVLGSGGHGGGGQQPTTTATTQPAYCG
jgi:mersacidin/lichenicidin family type 2 lantibiotic